VCRILKCTRTQSYYKKKMPEKDASVISAINEVIGQSRKGRNKVIVLVRKKHPEYGKSQIRRVYERNGFSLKKRFRKRMKDHEANPIEIPFKENIEWAIDFMSDALHDGRRIRTLNIIDHYNRKCKGIKIAINIPARVVVEFLNQRIELFGKPLKIRTDNGPEFSSELFQKWLKDNDICWSKIQKGSPQQNGVIERFNRTYREDVLDANIFHNIKQAHLLTQRWINDYNNERPHQALNYLTPSEYAA